MYYARIQRLPYQEDNKTDYRAELDSELGVLQWTVGSGDVLTHEYEQVDSDAPSWWHGDEEASDSFMRAMGVS